MSLKNIYTCFPGGKHKALTFSFDDGRVEDRRLVELFNQYGMKGTFNLNSGLHNAERIPVSEYKELYRGHEVACHTVLHPTIARSPLDQVAQQVLEDRRALEELVETPVRGLAYPNGSYTHKIMELLPALGIRYARTVRSTQGFAIPEDFTEWDPTCHFRRGMLELGQKFLTMHKTQYLYLMYVWGHSYELPEQDGWAQVEQFCQMMSHQDDIWYATNIEIVDALEDAARLQFTVDGDLCYNPNAASCWVSVGGKIYELPGGTTTRFE